MDRLERVALIAQITDSMRSHGSWGGETHIQKATYVLQQVFGLPTNFTFILYKHGPFSFDLRDELTGMQADGIVEQRPQPPYGPMYETTSMSHAIRQMNRDLVSQWESSIDRVATDLGALDVVRLEQVSSAVLVLSESPDADDAEAAAKLRIVKPHVDQSGAEWAISQAREILAQAATNSTRSASLS